jgi:hypothetical protein
MAKAKRYRWTCDGGHVGILAPARLRRRDIRRFCWPCSEASGTLVERHCPALERKRAARQERSAAKRELKRARELKRERERDPHNMRGWFKRLQRLQALKDHRWGWDRVTLECYQGERTARLGSAFGSWRIRLNTTSRYPEWAQLATLVHEMAHIVNRSRGGRGHDDGWRSIYGNAIYDLTGERMKASRHRYIDNANAVVRDWLEREVADG